MDPRFPEAVRLQRAGNIAAASQRIATAMPAACSLHEAITASHDAYEELALRFARNAAELARLRQKVAAARVDGPLFQPGRLCRNLEAAFTATWNRHRQGRPPANIAVRLGPPGEN
jgi:predicted O-linked N-acetylglucosamine transferase (SPINDLY family)